MNQNKLQEAESLLKSAANINPGSNLYLLTQAKLCRKNGNVKEAIKLIKKAVDNDPFLLSTYKELIGTTLGI
jgi:tetratricopeptide (TPR) repeat protein